MALVIANDRYTRCRATAGSIVGNPSKNPSVRWYCRRFSNELIVAGDYCRDNRTTHDRSSAYLADPARRDRVESFGSAYRKDRTGIDGLGPDDGQDNRTSTCGPG